MKQLPPTGVLVLILLVVSLPVLPPGAEAVVGGPVSNRTLYMTASRTLAFVHPTSSIDAQFNFTTAPLEFDLQTPLQTNTVTITGPMVLSLWLATNATAGVALTLEGSFDERFFGDGWNNVTSTDTRTIAPGPASNYTFTYNIPSQFLLDSATLSMHMRISSSPQKVLITLHVDSASHASYVALPLSGYATLDSKQPVSVLDRSGNPATSFDLNSTIPNNVVTFESLVRSAFGPQDIGFVNLTIIDPNLKPVRGATNIQMLRPDPTLPDLYRTTWVYRTNETQGTYQVYLDIFDVQGNRAFSFRGGVTFGLQRPSIFTSPLFTYVAYFSIGTAAVVGGSLYYRRRKTKKSYLVPFDYFNTLTGGELDGGTVVTVQGNTGAGKTLLSEQLMFEDLKKGRPCVFVATGDFPSNIRANMKTMGLDISGYEHSGLLTFVDGYSSEAGQESKEKFSVPSLGDLTTLGMKISSSLPSETFKGGSVYFDSLTPLVSKTRPESIVSFVQSLGARVKGMDGKAFFTVGPSVDGNVQRQLEEMADCVVQMEAFEEGGVRRSRLRVAKYRARRHQQSWVIYTIEEGKGIIFYSKTART